LLAVRDVPFLRSSVPSPEPASSRARRTWVHLASPVCSYLAIVLLFAVVPPGPLYTSAVKVDPGSPAARADIQNGDRIVSIDGTSVETFEEMREQIQRHTADTPIALRLRRNGKTEERTVERDPTGRIGVSAMEERTPSLLSRLGGAAAAPMRVISGTVQLLNERLLHHQGGGPVLLHPPLSDIGTEKYPLSRVWLGLVIQVALFWPLVLVRAIVRIALMKPG
jgi:hypothetical protein